MKKWFSILAIVCLVLTSFGTAFGYEALTGPSGVLRYNKANSYGGYTLFAPMIGCKTTYLMDMEGNVVHQWESDYPPGFFAMLLPDGNLLRGGNMTQKGDNKCNIGGAAGLVQEIDWSGKVVWEYKMNTPMKSSITALTGCPTATPCYSAGKKRPMMKFWPKAVILKAFPIGN